MKTHIILKGNSQVVKCSFDAINFMAIKSDTPLLLEIPDDADCLYIKGLVKTQRISLEKGKTPNFILIEDRKWAKWISLFRNLGYSITILYPLAHLMKKGNFIALEIVVAAGIFILLSFILEAMKKYHLKYYYS